MVFKGVGVASVKSLNLTQPPINLDPSAQKKKSPSLLQATIPLTNQPTNQPTNHTKWLTSRRLQLQSLCPIAQGQSNPSPPNARCWLSCNPNAPGKIWESERVGYNVGSMWLYIYISNRVVSMIYLLGTHGHTGILEIFIDHVWEWCKLIQYPLTINTYLNYIYTHHQICHFLPVMSYGFQSLLLVSSKDNGNLTAKHKESNDHLQSTPLPHIGPWPTSFSTSNISVHLWKG